MEIFKLFGSIFVNTDAADQSIQKTEKNAESFASKLGNGIKTAAKWGAAIVTGATVAGTALIGFATKSASTADNIDKMSQKIGISREAYQELDFVCSQSGMSVDQLQAGIKSLTSAMDGARSGTAANVEQFEKLGVAVVNTDGSFRSQEDVFFDVIAALQEMDDQTEKARLATELFGRSGSELMPLLNSASGSIEEMRKQAHDLGLVLSDELIDSGVNLTDSLDQTKRAFAAIGTQLGASLMPIVEKASDYIQKSLPAIRSLVERLAPVITGLLDSLLPPLMDLAEAIFPVLVELIEQLMPTVIEIVQQILPVLVEIIKALLPLAIEIIQALLPVLVELVQELLPPILEIVRSILPVLVELIKMLLPPIMEIIQLLLPVLVDLIQMILPLILEIIQAVLPVLVTLIKSVIALLDPILQLLRPLIDLLMALLKPLIQLLGQILPPLISVLEMAAKIISGVLQPAIEILAKVIGGVLNVAFESVAAVVSTVVSFITGHWQEAGKTLAGIFGKLKEDAVGKFTELKENGLASFENLKAGVLERFSKLGDGIREKLDSVKNFAKDCVDKLKAFFNFDWQLPKIKLPHFSMEGSFSLTPPSIPHISVEWYKKAMDNPLLMEKPTAFGISPDGRIMAGGEAGSEVVSGTETLMGMIKAAVMEAAGENNAAMSETLGRIYGLLAEYLPKLVKMQIVLDTGAVVGELAVPMNEALGWLTHARGRRN